MPCRRVGNTLGPSTALVFLLTGCTQGGLAPRGSEAVRIADVFWALVIAGGIVTVIVLAAWGWGVRRSTTVAADEDTDAEHDDSLLERRFLIGGGILLPAVVVTGFFGVQIATTMAQPQDGDVVIEVIGHQYWWDVRYQNVPGVEPFATANEIHIPTGTQVQMVLRSEDVIHSLWVPQLAGKVDLVPGRESQMVFSADEPGTYPGYCAEFCGLQHAWMKFDVVAVEPQAFQRWAERHAGPAPEPTGDQEADGREVFLGHSCVGCHTIRGVSQAADTAPDLTHLASRNEIGAGILPLTEEHLTAFVVNPQAVKPGVHMPPQPLTADEADALVAYLMSLE